MEATDLALREHGYADVSMAKIAAEFDGSQSLLHYHFGSKDELIAEYVRHAREWFEEHAATFPEDPEERLEALLASTVDAEFVDADPERMAPIVEMYGQAPENDDLAAALRAYDRTFRDLLSETLGDGREEGVFADVDVDAATWLIFAVHESAFLRRLAGEDVDGLEDALEQFVLSEMRR